MRTFHKIDEFRTEAANALFTKQQAISVTMRLLELELADPQNSEEEKQECVTLMRPTPRRTRFWTRLV